MTTRWLLVLVGIGGLVLMGIGWAYYSSEQQAAYVRKIQVEENRRRQEQLEAYRSTHDGAAPPYEGVRYKPWSMDAGPCDCQPGDPLCSCL